MKAKLQAWQSQIKSEERMGLPFMKSKILQKTGGGRPEKEKQTPTVGLEPTTTRLRALRSTD
ncbi:hypothetical protein E1A91_D09G175900v1 [Gossypium mustelinum]|uniref:Uncharacterized protein n=1 Tax=Gossypium mustelinum TaxID=34275 RepID=A0A5D2TN57_GOSMU|nr:hypothetical protein E1A91_D09G175900v1 [Gossypium mustelinum]